MAAPFARNVLLATRARLAPAVAARAASTLSTSAFSGSFAQSPAIMMMALDRAPAQTVVGAFSCLEMDTLCVAMFVLRLRLSVR